MMSVSNIGIFLFDEIEVLDFAGPFEVFSVTELESGKKPFNVITISETGEMVTARNGLRVQPDYAFETVPKLDILIVPGGHGATSNEIHKEQVIEWIVTQSENVDVVISVCTGAFLLAKAGLLDGKQATTHWRSIDKMAAQFPKVEVLQRVKFVDEGKILTSAGISAGINVSFHLIERILGENEKRRTAKRMEFDI